MENIWIFIQKRSSSSKFLALLGFFLILLIIGFLNPSSNSVGKKKLPKNSVELAGDAYQVFKTDTQIWMAVDMDLALPGSKCYNENLQCLTKLYTWQAASEACRALGYRLPTLLEWKMLAHKMKSIAPNQMNKFNSTFAYRILTENFNIRLSGKGIMYTNGSFKFDDAYQYGYYWTKDGHFIIFNSMTKTMTHKFRYEPSLFSCRCVKDI